MQKKPHTNVVVYARQAVAGKKGSIETQLDRLTSLLEDRKDEGWTVKKKLADPERSGFQTDRPAYRKLVKLVRSGRIDLVAVTQLDRLSRNVRDFAKFLGELDRRGVWLVTLDGWIDVATALRLLAEKKKRRRS